MRTKSREGYFNVDPIITLPTRTPFFPGIQGKGDGTAPRGLLDDTTSGAITDRPERPVPIDALSVLSIIAKWQGPMSGWDAHLAEASRRGYNFIHYTPLQERGASGSPYSIRDQYAFDPALLRAGATDGGVAETREMMRRAKREYGLGSLTDVVLNHTAPDSPWLQEHPEAGYSPANSPHLAPALELDTAMIELSGRLGALGLPTRIESEDDLAAVMRAVRQTVADLNLWQYYVLDVEREREAIRALGSAGAAAWTGEDVAGKSAEELAGILIRSGKVEGYRSLAGRFVTRVDPAVAAGLVAAVNPGESDPAAAWGRVCDVVNVDLYRECEDDLESAVEGIEGRLKYTRYEAHGPRLGEISAE